MIIFHLQNYVCIFCEFSQSLKKNVTENVSIFTANVTDNVKEYVELTEENSGQRKENS